MRMPERKTKKKEMTIKIKSTPKGSSKTSLPQKSPPRSERRPRDLRRKGARGNAWIG